MPVSFLLSCSSDLADDLPNPVEVDMTLARLNDFPLTEVDYVDIDIVHPEIRNGQETRFGSITITLPFTADDLLYSLESANIDFSKFKISPAVGEQRLFSQTEPVVYEVTSLENAQQSIHYEVKVIINDPVEVDLTEALLTDFPLLEVNYVDIDIVQPEINDGQETKAGTITITVPFTDNDLLYSLRSVNFELSKFTISPRLGERKLFSETNPVIYEITSLENAQQRIHYEVIVQTEEKDPLILGFKFLAADHAELSSDVDFFLETEDPTDVADALIYVIFPNGVDFSQLVPTVEFDAAKLEYRLNNDAYVAYPSSGTQVDFKYPNTVDFKVSSGLGTKTRTYRIIADVATPVKFAQSEVVIDEIEAGENYVGIGVIKWTNEGNYPIDATSLIARYTDVSTPISGDDTNIFSILLQGGRAVNPGEEKTVNIVVNNAPTTLGEYRSKTTFTIRFDIQELKAGFRFISPIGEDFVEEIYEYPELLIRGNVVDK